jgi:hypothetical protein
MKFCDLALHYDETRNNKGGRYCDNKLLGVLRDLFVDNRVLWNCENDLLNITTDRQVNFKAV